jgi:hypothetical protein
MELRRAAVPAALVAESEAGVTARRIRDLPTQSESASKSLRLCSDAGRPSHAAIEKALRSHAMTPSQTRKRSSPLPSYADCFSRRDRRTADMMCSASTGGSAVRSLIMD